MNIDCIYIDQIIDNVAYYNVENDVSEELYSNEYDAAINDFIEGRYYKRGDFIGNDDKDNILNLYHWEIDIKRTIMIRSEIINLQHSIGMFSSYLSSLYQYKSSHDSRKWVEAVVSLNEYFSGNKKLSDVSIPYGLTHNFLNIIMNDNVKKDKRKKINVLKSPKDYIGNWLKGKDINDIDELKAFIQSVQAITNDVKYLNRISIILHSIYSNNFSIYTKQNYDILVKFKAIKENNNLAERYIEYNNFYMFRINKIVERYYKTKKIDNQINAEKSTEEIISGLEAYNYIGYNMLKFNPMNFFVEYNINQ